MEEFQKVHNAFPSDDGKKKCIKQCRAFTLLNINTVSVL